MASFTNTLSETSSDARPEVDPELNIKTFYLGCLAQGSYMISHKGSAFIIDPRRDVDMYLEEISSLGLRLKGVLETHVHADFVSGHKELSSRMGVPIFIGAGAGVKCGHYPVDDGEVLVLSEDYAFLALSTPGHTLGCTTWVLVDRAYNNRPMMAFTGDTLFVGSVGRPDLLGSVGKSKEEMAGLLFDSLHGKLLRLPEDVVVYPAHGPGSPCGKSMSSDPTSTIGKERLTNAALQFTDKAAFVEFLTEGLAPPPQYFLNAVQMNLAGAESMADVLGRVPMLSPAAFQAAMGGAAEAKSLALSDKGATTECKGEGEEEVLVLDTRGANDFAPQFIPGSVNFPVGINGGEIMAPEEGNFGIWIGTMLNPKTPLLVLSAPGKEQESLQRLARVGFQNVLGVLEGGIAAWVEAGLPTSSSGRCTLTGPEQLQGEVTILDVRTPGEFACTRPLGGHANGAINIPLPTMNKPGVFDGLDKDATYLCYCLGGFRSAIAASFMRRAGLNVRDIVGGKTHMDKVADSAMFRNSKAE